MGWKSVLGVGKTNFDTVQLGYPATVSSMVSYSGGVLTINVGGLGGGTPLAKSGAGAPISLTNLVGTGTAADIASLNQGGANGSGLTINAVTASTIAINVPGSPALNILSLTGGNVAFAGAGGGVSNNNALAYTQYGPVGGVISTNAWATPTPNITQAMGTLNNYSAHTASRMGLLTANILFPSATIIHQLVIGGVPGQQVVAFTPSTGAGVQVTDLSHTDVVPGSGTSLALSQGWTGVGVQTGYYVYSGVFWEGDYPGGASIPLAKTIGGVNSPVGGTSSPAWRAPVGAILNSSNTLGPAQAFMPNAGVWSNIQINVFQNGGNSNTNTGTTRPYTSCVSPAYQGSSTTPVPGNQIVNVPGGTYGILTDLSHVDAVPAGSYICTEFFWNTSFNVYFTAMGSTWTPAQPNVTPWICADGVWAGVSGTPALAVNSIGYTLPRMGAVNFGAQPVEDSAGLPVGGTFSNHTTTFAFAVAAGTQPTFLSGSYPGNALVAGNQTGVVPTSPGAVTDLSHTDAIPAGGIYTGLFTNLSPSFSLSSQTAALTTPQVGMRLGMMGVG